MRAASSSLHTGRRAFLKRACAAITGPAILPARVLGADGTVAPSNRVALGFVGLGSHGVGMNLKSFLHLPDAQVVALCDVDSQRLDKARDLIREHYAEQKRGSTDTGCFATGDWREVVARDDVDAVVVSTPDHWHVLPSVAAMRASKDVMCEKPLSLTVREGRILSDTAARYASVFQTATENRSKRNFLRVCELVRNGRIGRLHTIRTELPKGSGTVGAQGKTHRPEPVPSHLDYDMWLGPAPEAPYTPARCHYNFRWILDYSGGYMTDWGAHINDIAQWGNDTEYGGPVSVQGRGVFPEDGLYNTAIEWEVTYQYATGVTLICKSGTPSIRFEGTDGWLRVPSWGGNPEASAPEILRSPIGPGDIRLRTCAGREQRDFLDCIKTRRQTYAPAEIGHRTATICHIGNIAMILGRKLQWSPETERFADDEQANAMLSRPMRSPWVL